MVEQRYLEDVVRQLRKYKEMAEKAVAQLPEEHFSGVLDLESNSIALIMKHMAGNMRSRWTDFLTTDGEKSDRERDTEFFLEEGETREQIVARWEEGWSRTFAAIEALGEDDLMRVVTIRGESHLVLEAVQRQLTHYSYHVGQIVLLAKHYVGRDWQSLSIPRGRSKDVDVAKDGTPYRTDREDET